MYKNIITGGEGYVGWMGYGGSIFQWHPEEKISFSYVPFDYNNVDIGNAAGLSIQRVVMDCIKGTHVS